MLGFIVLLMLPLQVVVLVCWSHHRTDCKYNLHSCWNYIHLYCKGLRRHYNYNLSCQQ